MFSGLMMCVSGVKYNFVKPFSPHVESVNAKKIEALVPTVSPYHLSLCLNQSCDKLFLISRCVLVSSLHTHQHLNQKCWTALFIEKWERAWYKTDWDRKRDGKGRGLAQELSTLSTCGENGLTKLYFTLDTHIIKPENIFHKTDTILRENEKSCSLTKKRCFFASIFFHSTLNSA